MSEKGRWSFLIFAATAGACGALNHWGAALFGRLMCIATAADEIIPAIKGRA